MRALPLLLLIGCGPDLNEACMDYMAAQNACWNEAGGDTGTWGYTSDGAATCAILDNVRGAAARKVAKTWECQAAVYRSADCSTPDGVDEADNQAIIQCL